MFLRARVQGPNDPKLTRPGRRRTRAMDGRSEDTAKAENVHCPGSPCSAWLGPVELLVQTTLHELSNLVNLAS
jgi:hypothetical protein